MKTLDLNTSPVLPASSASTEGATSGSLGDASMADLKKGFHELPDDNPGERESLFVSPVEERQTGFLNRPNGWER